MHSPRCWPALSPQLVFKGSSGFITVLLKTLIFFISNPYGPAFLAYLLAGLAGFLAAPLISLLIYSTKGFSAVLWGREVMIIIISRHNLLSARSSSKTGLQRPPRGSSWRPGLSRVLCTCWLLSMGSTYLFAWVSPFLSCPSPKLGAVW